MKHIYLLLFTALAVTIFSSCTKELDLDEETLLLLEKQEKLERLDELFYLAFKEPVRAETEYNQFVRDELITETQNFLLNNEVNNSYTFTKLAIQLNLDHHKIAGGYNQTTLFEIYKTMYEVDLSNRTLWGSIPEQVKSGEQLELFEKKMKEIKAFHQDQIALFMAQNKTDESLTNKTWVGMGFAYKPDFSAFYSINFNFVLHDDKSWDYEDFFFMPAIPKTGALAGAQEEKDLDKDDLLSPLKYAVYDDRIFFHFHIRNNYNYEDQSGKLERVWNYEYKYELREGQLLLTEPRILNYMFPVLHSIDHDGEDYKKNYLEAFIGFDQGFTLSIQ
ncbi:hypothetical protein [Proteiniphilum sp.]|uniref:hypothetical protein n=1 Tax=Proteiniphilum sp. TaxID=1926877 RepID=UPI002B1F2536|nr:hypothetical protein [Proteiniphilum sp.]MEA4917398.1 hypothetical protein [Proteiniphilum sp.]